jgi:hypothetical protein
MSTSSARAVLLALAITLLVALAGCGGSGGGSSSSSIDHSSPESVVRAYIDSLSKCGPDGAGVRANLVYGDRYVNNYRENLIPEEEAVDGCHPAASVPQITVARIPSPWSDAPLALKVDNEECQPEDVPLIKDENGNWLVMEGGNKFDPNFSCFSNTT